MHTLLFLELEYHLFISHFTYYMIDYVDQFPLVFLLNNVQFSGNPLLNMISTALTICRPRNVDVRYGLQVIMSGERLWFQNDIVF